MKTLQVRKNAFRSPGCRLLRGAAASAFLLAALWAVFPSRADAAGSRVRGIAPDVPPVTLAVVSPRPFTIGDPIDVSLTVYHPRDEEITCPEDEALFLPFELRKVRVHRRRAGGGTVKTMVLYTVSAYRTGNITLGPLPVTVHGEAQKTDAVTVPILSVLPSDGRDARLRDIMGPYRARIRPVTILIIFGSLAAAFLLYLLLSRLLKRKRRTRVVAEHRRKPFDPYRFTLKELENLGKRYRREFMDEKEVYLHLSHLLRLYFGHVRSFRALEMTTSQIERQLRGSGDDGLDRRFLEVLVRSDLVKFARQKPGHRTIADDIEHAISLVNRAHEEARQAPPADTGAMAGAGDAAGDGESGAGGG